MTEQITYTLSYTVIFLNIHTEFGYISTSSARSRGEILTFMSTLVQT